MQFIRCTSFHSANASIPLHSISAPLHFITVSLISLQIAFALYKNPTNLSCGLAAFIFGFLLWICRFVPGIRFHYMYAKVFLLSGQTPTAPNPLRPTLRGLQCEKTHLSCFFCHPARESICLCQKKHSSSLRSGNPRQCFTRFLPVLFLSSK